MAGKGHVGKAGHLAAMAEFLLRGYNVAMPEVDIGDDIFVVHDQRGQLWRTQVKTAVGQKTRRGYRGKYAVTLEQMMTSKDPDLFYVFALRRDTTWEFMVIPREALVSQYMEHDAGSQAGERVVFTLHFSDSDVICSGQDWQRFRNNWPEWPALSD